MEIEILKEEDITYLIIHGELDATSAIPLDEKLKHLLEEGVSSILVDCNDLEYISSAGLGVFMSYISDFEEKGTRFAIFGLKEKVHKVFELVGLNKLIKISPTKQLALKEIV